VSNRWPPLRHPSAPAITAWSLSRKTIYSRSCRRRYPGNKFFILSLLIPEFSFSFRFSIFPNLPITHCGQCVLFSEGGTCRRTVPAYLYGHHTRVISIPRMYQRGSNRFLLIDSPNRLGRCLSDFHAVYITESRPLGISKNLPAKDRILLSGIS